MSASAGMPSAAAAATASSMRTVPSTIEYSLCRRRWTNDGAGIEERNAVRLAKRTSKRDCYNSTSFALARIAFPRARSADALHAPLRARHVARARRLRDGEPPAPPPATPAAPQRPRRTSSRRRRPSTCRAFRRRIGWASATAARPGAARRSKDPVRFGNDGNYRVGWQDGLAQCKRKMTMAHVAR